MFAVPGRDLRKGRARSVRSVGRADPRRGSASMESAKSIFGFLALVMMVSISMLLVTTVWISIVISRYVCSRFVLMIG